MKEKKTPMNFVLLRACVRVRADASVSASSNSFHSSF